MISTPDQPAPTYIDLQELLATNTQSGAIWSGGLTDLNINLLHFAPGEAIDAHANHEVEVLLVGVAGSSTIVVNDEPFTLTANHALVIPRGATRMITAGPAGCAYLSCHRQRAKLWPTNVPKPSN